jgi:hypothetical protein
VVFVSNHGNGLSDTIKGDQFNDYLSDYKVPRRILLM